MYTRLTEADEIIDALRDHTRRLRLGKASPQSEGGGHGPPGKPHVLPACIRESKARSPNI